MKRMALDEMDGGVGCQGPTEWQKTNDDVHWFYWLKDVINLSKIWLCVVLFKSWDTISESTTRIHQNTN